MQNTRAIANDVEALDGEDGSGRLAANHSRQSFARRRGETKVNLSAPKNALADIRTCIYLLARMSLPLAELPPAFKALADPTRLRIMNLLSEGEVCVCFLSEVLRMVQPKISRHLAYLKK